MSGQGRLSGPGELARPGSLVGPGELAGTNGQETAAAAPDTGVPGAGTAGSDPFGAGLPGEALATYALEHKLEPASALPPILTYLKQLWQRRQFITGFATAMNVAMYSEARLGQLWQILTPLLNAAVYFLIFGVLLGINRGVPDFIPFLVTGIFVFNFTQRSCITASTVMRDSLPLIRALPFPRACLPLGYVIIELQQLVLSFGVLGLIVLVTGEPPTWYWFLVLPVLVLQTLFNVGCAFILARWGSGFDDVSQLLPFIVRTWMYASGVIFSIQTTLRLIPGKFLYNHPTLAYLMQINPAAIYITLIRNALLWKQHISMPGYHAYNAYRCMAYGDPSKLHISAKTFTEKHMIYYSSYCHATVSVPSMWLYAVGWAILAAVVGFIFFWRAETRYGRG